MFVHWLVFVCLFGSGRSRLLEIDGGGDKDLGVLDISGVQGDVGIIIGLQSVVKARLENMEKDMEVRSRTEEAWRTEMREKLVELIGNPPQLPQPRMEGAEITSTQSRTEGAEITSTQPPPAVMTPLTPTSTTKRMIVQNVKKTSNYAGRDVLTVTRGGRRAVLVHEAPDCVDGLVSIYAVREKWSWFNPITEVEYIKGPDNRSRRYCVIMVEGRRPRVICTGDHILDIISDERTWFLCYVERHQEL